jgi:hypothetical protein
LLEILHGSLPFLGNDMASLRAEVFAHRVQPPPPHSDIPEPVSAVLRRGMRRAASARYPNMEAFVESLSRAAEITP